MAIMDDVGVSVRELMAQGVQEDVATRQVLNNQDYHNPNTVKELFGYVSNLINMKMARDLPLTELEVKTAHFILTKISLVDLGLDNVAINYSPVRPAGANFAAFYRPGNPPSVNFFDEMYVKPELTIAFPNRNPESGGLTRIVRFLEEMQIIEHEIQHGVQDIKMQEANANPDSATPYSYILSKQKLARIFTTEQVEGNKYFRKGTSADRLYLDNHDNFYQELDSDKYGYDRAYRILIKINRELFNRVQKHTNIGQIYDQKFDLLTNYDTVMWNHDTNPNDAGVAANHKASLIIDTTLARMSPVARAKCFEDNPMLQLSYNKNGTKKSLEQIESERDAKVKKILSEGTDTQVRNEANTIIKLYDTIIESDPVLSFEWCLRHIVHLGYADEKYFTDVDTGLKFSPKAMREEIRVTAEKAKMLCRYVEAIDSKLMHTLIKKYSNENFKMPKHNPTQVRYFQDRKMVIFDIERELNKNEELYRQYYEDIRNARTKQAAMDRAKEDLSKAFPGVTVSKFNGVLNEQGQIELIPNKQQKILLSISAAKYMSEYGSLPIDQRAGLVSPAKIYQAISTMYSDIITTIDDRKEIETLIQSGELGVYAGATMEVISNMLEEESTVQIEPVILESDAAERADTPSNNTEIEGNNDSMGDTE